MAIRLRTVNGVRVALLAANSTAEDGDVYLTEDDHHALMMEFSKRDTVSLPNPPLLLLSDYELELLLSHGRFFVKFVATSTTSTDTLIQEVMRCYSAVNQEKLRSLVASSFLRGVFYTNAYYVTLELRRILLNNHCHLFAYSTRD